MEWFSKAIEAAKSPKLVGVIFSVSAALIWLPAGMLQKMKLVDFANAYGLYIGIALLASFVILAFELCGWGWRFIGKKSAKAERDKATLERIRSLDEAEKSILREFYIQAQNTVKMPLDHPVVAGLLRAGILQGVGSFGRKSIAGMVFSLQIRDTVRANLMADDLGIPNGSPTQNEIDNLLRMRPDFIKQIARMDNLLRW